MILILTQFFIIILFSVQSFLFLGNKSILIKNISVKEGKIPVILTLCESQDLSYLALLFLEKHEAVCLGMYPKYVTFITHYNEISMD